MDVYVGLDCGGSSSRVLAVDGQGNVLFQGQSGAANLVSTPDSRLRSNLAHATRDCPAATTVCGCFAGLISEEIRLRGIQLLQELFPTAQVRAEPDYTAAFLASPPDTNVCVIAGTGSLVCSRRKGAMVKSGGRGYILGDSGSGFWYGRDALAHFLDDPRNASNSLRNEVLRLFRSEDEAQIIPQVYRAATPATILAKLVKALGADARAEEIYALDSIRRHTADLAQVVARHIEVHLPDLTSLQVSLAGGVWKAAPQFGQEFTNQLEDRLRGRILTVVRLTRPPLHGAVELARELHHGN